jgi:pyruvate,orthophosphate dikinase
MLQTRNGKRTAAAALKFAADMVKEKLIDWETAVLRNPADQLDQLLAPIFDAADVKKAKELARGLPAGPGAASGQIYLNAERAVAAEARGEKVLLVRNETSPEDLRGMLAAEGILTAKGGVSSHAALVARQMGKVCVCGAAGVEIDYAKKTVIASGQSFSEGDFMSIDGTAGTVYGGQIKTAPSEIITGIVSGNASAQKTEKFKNFKLLMDWCAKTTRLAVRTNADTPEQTRIALAFGATGIGLTRTCQPPSACWIHHSTSSCPTPRSNNSTSRRKSASAWIKSSTASNNSTSSIQCSATAAAAWVSLTLKSPKCRPAPSSKPPPTS